MNAIFFDASGNPVIHTGASVILLCRRAHGAFSQADYQSQS
jgi:hypothetical protein